MNKIGMAFLLAAAACFAVWIVLMRLRAPEPGACAGWRKRFALATWLFVAALGASAGCTRTCYSPPPPPPPTGASNPQANVLATLRAVWLTLDPARGEEFRKQIEALVAQGRLQEPEGRMLAMAYVEIAWHRKRVASNVTCYDMTQLGGVLYQSRENALKQVELLREAARKGTIDLETAAKAGAALARELEMLSVSGGGMQEVDKGEEALIRKLQEKAERPSDPAKSAASRIVGLEGGPMPEKRPSAPFKP